MLLIFYYDAQFTIDSEHHIKETLVIDSVESNLGYSDGVDPQQQCAFIVTAQELDVVRLFLDAGMLGRQRQKDDTSERRIAVIKHFTSAKFPIG